MKRITIIAILLILLMTNFFIFTNNYVYGDEFSSAETLLLNSSKTNTCNGTYYYKFIPKIRDYYEFTVTSTSEETPNIILYDSEGSAYVSGSWDEGCCVSELYANKTYYIEINAYSSDNNTFKLTAKKHIHSIVEYDYNPSEVTAYYNYDGYYSEYCTRCDYDVWVTVPAIKKISLSKTSYTYDGKIKKPQVVIIDRWGNQVASQEYILQYSNGRKKVGKYKVNLTFNGNKYIGSGNLYFTINPKGTSLSSVKASSKGFTAKWKKQSTETTGYQLQYSTSSKFKSAKTVTISKNKTVTKAIKKLKGKKKYYVRVRTYKIVGKTKYYSSWSPKKSVKTK